MAQRMTCIVLGLALLAACGGGGGATGRLQASPLLMTAGVQRLDPASPGGDAPGDVRARFGVDRVSGVYDFTTPAGASFRFDMTVRAAGGGGAAGVGLGHASDGGATPVGGPETMGSAGVVPLANRLETRDIWLVSDSEGQARMTVRGTIDRDQLFLVESRDGADTAYDLVRIRVGPRSAINRVVDNEGGDRYAGIEEEKVIHSSNAWTYGLPAIATSGDRTSVVLYEGRPDRNDRDGDGVRPAIFDYSTVNELRLQLHRESCEVTGAPPVEASEGNGIFRDHEIAALHNVLALVRATPAGPRVEISFDRGATFGQAKVFEERKAWSLPIVQIDIAPNYRLALAYWRILTIGDKPGDPLREPEFESQLVLIEARPSATDDNGSPTAYTFGPERVVYAEGRDLSPTLMGLRGTANGDLAVGYGFTRFEFERTDQRVIMTTEYRCATRVGDDGTFTDTLVHEEEIAAIDPSVDLDGEGEDLRIFYACETSDGVSLYTSGDGGATFDLESEIDSPGAHMAQVCARTQGDALRVDLLYLTPTRRGLELHVRHWDDFDGDAAPVDGILVRASIEDGAGGGEIDRLVDGVVLRQVGDHGYDAVEDGDDVAVVVHKVTVRADDIFFRLPPIILPDDPNDPGLPNRDARQVATQPPLAPGLTDPVPEPDPDHRHHTCVLYLD